MIALSIVGWVSLGIMLLLAWLTWLLVAIVCSHDCSTIRFVIVVVGKDVVLFCINYVFNELSSMVTLLLKDLTDDVHNVRTNRWTPPEHPFYDSSCYLLKLAINILDQFEGWFADFLELRLQEIDQQIDRRETWDAVALMHYDCSLNSHVGVFLRDIDVAVLLIQSEELFFNSGTT